MKKKSYRLILAIFLIIPLTHLMLNFFLSKQFQRIINREIISFGYINSDNKHKIELLGAYGNVFDPKKYNVDVDYDLVPVTCILEPISQSKDIITWESNDLLRSALINTFPDSLAFKKTVDELITTMSANGDLIKYFLFTPLESYKISDYEQRQKLKVYFWKVPQNGDFYIKTRIIKMAALPIFDPRVPNQSYNIKSRLKENLKLVIHRLFDGLEEKEYHEINSVAFAALAGTTRRIDSHYYLNYKNSFFTIYDSLLSSNIPKQIDRVYFIVYDNLPTKEERRDALNGLFELFRYSKHFNFWGFEILLSQPVIRALPFTVIFIIIFLGTYPNIKRLFIDKKYKKERTDFLIRTGEVFSVAIPGITILSHLVLLTMRYNFIFCIIGEFFISYLLYKTIIWLNTL